MILTSHDNTVTSGAAGRCPLAGQQCQGEVHGSAGMRSAPAPAYLHEATNYCGRAVASVAARSSAITVATVASGDETLKVDARRRDQRREPRPRQLRDRSRPWSRQSCS